MSVIIYNTKYCHITHPRTQLDLFGKLGNTPSHHKKNVFFGSDTPNRYSRVGAQAGGLRCKLITYLLEVTDSYGCTVSGTSL